MSLKTIPHYMSPAVAHLFDDQHTFHTLPYVNVLLSMLRFTGEQKRPISWQNDGDGAVSVQEIEM